MYLENIHIHDYFILIYNPTKPQLFPYLAKMFLFLQVYCQQTRLVIFY